MRSGPSPRDRLLQRGAESLTDAEVLAVILGGRTTTETAERILHNVSGVPGLLVADRRALKRCGLTDSRAAVVMASIDLLRRITAWRSGYRPLLDRPEKVAQHISFHYPTIDQEIMGALYLNTRHHLITGKVLFRGTIDRCSVEPRQILREAIDHRANGIVIWHVHPSGDPSPSESDKRFTRRVGECCDLFGMDLIDHVIVGNGGRYVSMNRRQPW